MGVMKTQTNMLEILAFLIVKRWVDDSFLLRFGLSITFRLYGSSLYSAVLHFVFL